MNLATWGEEDVDFSDEEEKHEEDLFCLMTLDCEFDEIYDLNLSCSSGDDDIDNLYHELYNSLVKTKKDLKSKIVENELVVDKIKQLEKRKSWFEYTCWSTFIQK